VFFPDAKLVLPGPCLIYFFGRLVCSGHRLLTSLRRLLFPQHRLEQAGACFAMPCPSLITSAPSVVLWRTRLVMSHGVGMSLTRSFLHLYPILSRENGASSIPEDGQSSARIQSLCTEQFERKKYLQRSNLL
jgi:hypothetical protein